jgi:hypothetical protein
MLKLREAMLAALFAIGAGRPAGAQSGAVIFGASVIGYGWLSAASIGRLREGGRPAAAGDSLRMTLRRPREGGEIDGRVLSITQDTLTLQIGDTTRGLALDDLARVRVYAGVESKWAIGWAIGFAAGMSAGAFDGYVSGGSPPGCDFICLNRDQATLAGGIAGAVAGSILGAGIGALAEGARWRTVSHFVPSHAVGLAPVLGPERGLAVRVSF